MYETGGKESAGSNSSKPPWATVCLSVSVVCWEITPQWRETKPCAKMIRNLCMCVLVQTHTKFPYISTQPAIATPLNMLVCMQHTTPMYDHCIFFSDIYTISSQLAFGCYRPSSWSKKDRQRKNIQSHYKHYFIPSYCVRFFVWTVSVDGFNLSNQTHYSLIRADRHRTKRLQINSTSDLKTKRTRKWNKKSQMLPQTEFPDSESRDLPSRCLMMTSSLIYWKKIQNICFKTL